MEKTLFDQRTIADNIAGAVPMDNIAGTAGRPTTNGFGRLWRKCLQHAQYINDLQNLYGVSAVAGITLPRYA